MNKRKIIISSLIIVVVCIMSGIFTIINKNKIKNVNNIENDYKTKINVSEYEEKIENIKYKTNKGIIYEDDMIKLTTYYPDYEEEYDDDEYRDNAFVVFTEEDGNAELSINDIHITNKTSDDITYYIDRATMSNCNILDDTGDTIEPGEDESISFEKITYCSELLEAMGIGALNDINLEIELKTGNTGERIKKSINIKTDCKEKAKEFELSDRKVYDKDGIKIFLLEKYIQDNTYIAEEVKRKMIEEGYDSEEYADKLVQNNGFMSMIVINENKEEQKININVECSSNEELSNSQIEKIEGNIIDKILVSDGIHNDNGAHWVEKEKEYNPKNIKYNFSINGENIFSVDFNNAEVK